MEVSFITAFLAGIISFVSPCVLPLVPGYLSFMSGVSIDDIKGQGKKGVLKKVTLNTIFFVLGFSLVFIAFGATATALGQFLGQNKTLISRIAGILVIVFGLHFMGVFRIKWLLYEKRLEAQTKGAGYLSSFLIGFAFAFGWTPCIGPILAGILTLASAQESVWQGVLLLAVYSAGLGIPFLITGLAFNSFLSVSSRIKRHFRVVEAIGGGLLVIVGLLLVTNSFGLLSGYIAQLFPWLSLG
ncbi:MAG: cytochrome C biogenesis protein [candidate division Zixibacteria bacterium CG_4_9_14_3_um_filter_46_8]|nr:MAG: cytochrome C biogenesis protein [candidate division Zixibacteria bacterium CG_4_9_14_3_um_filter_46_8]